MISFNLRLSEVLPGAGAGLRGVSVGEDLR